jgi:aspartate/tyrosine/aromatic aminotransferase
MYSMSPGHGAAIVAGILASPQLTQPWQGEVGGMRARIAGLRLAVTEMLRAAQVPKDFQFIATQRGMFSFLGLTAAQVRAMRERHIYMTQDSRINIAGLNAANLEYFVGALREVLRS